MAILANDPKNHSTSSRERENDRSSRSALTMNFGRRIPVPILNPPSAEETQAEGRMLFQDFVQTQVMQEGLEQQYTQLSVIPPNMSNVLLRNRHDLHHGELVADGDSMVSYDETDSTRDSDESLYASYSFPAGFKNPLWAKTGRELRQLADKFAQSEERKLVKEKANQVNIENITMGEFQDLLCELFHDGIVRRERIVTLFFFCTDVVIRALKQKIASQVHHLFTWSMNFITERVCRWVQEQGGWGVVIGNYVPKLVFTVCAFTVTMAAAFFIWKNW